MRAGRKTRRASIEFGRGMGYRVILGITA